MTINTFLMTDGISNQEMDLGRFVKDSYHVVHNHEIDEAIYYLTGITVMESKVKNRDPKLVEIRQVGMYFYILNSNSLSESGKVFGRDHATALYSKHKIENYYGVKWEKRLTDFVNKVSERTRIDLPLSLKLKIL